MFNHLPPLPILLAQCLVLFLAIGVHEYAHCKFADMAGDPTARLQGRVTLNLFKHFELVGTLMMAFTMLAGVGVGWGKPAPVNPRLMRNPRWDWFVSVAAGPISNLIQATLYAVVLRVVFAAHIDFGSSNFLRQFISAWLIFGVLINISLAFFNLIPFGPLDGKWLIGLLLPEKQRLAWFRFHQQIGIFGLFLVVYLIQQSNIDFLDGPIMWTFTFLTGLKGF